MNDRKSPNYKKIYTDILEDKYPHKVNLCSKYLKKPILTYFDITELNKIIFGETQLGLTKNQKHKGYSKEEIIYMLEFQKKNSLNNSQLANHFKLSRNSITKWRKLFGGL